MNVHDAILKFDLERSRAELVSLLAKTAPARRTCSAQVVTLFSFSEDISGLTIAEHLANNLRSETGEPVLLVRLTGCPAKGSSLDREMVRPTVNGEFYFSPRPERSPTGMEMLSVEVACRPHDPGWITSLTNYLGCHFSYVLVWAGREIPTSTICECINQSMSTYLFFKQDPDDWRRLGQFLSEVRLQCPSGCRSIKPILCLEENERADGLDDLTKLIGRPPHAFVHGDQSGSASQPGRQPGNRHFCADIRRLSREVGGCRVGLALSSGGAKGLAHIGVIQVLEENGIDVDIIAGSSMGAYVGAVWAYGYDGLAMEKLAREVKGRWGSWRLIDPAFPPRHGFIHGLAGRRRLMRSIGNAQFSDLVRPLRIVATNLDTLERVVFASGEVAAAVHASSAIPGICVPVTIDGETYIDGGISDPLPVDVLREMGVERIIAVNTIPTPAFLRCCREMEREQAVLRGKRPGLSRMLNEHLNYFARGNILDIMHRSVTGAQIRVAEEACQHADVVLRPLAIDAHWHEFSNPAKYIAIGRRVAEERLDEIKSLLKRKNSFYENQPAHEAMARAA